MGDHCAKVKVRKSFIVRRVPVSVSVSGISRRTIAAPYARAKIYPRPHGRTGLKGGGGGDEDDGDEDDREREGEAGKEGRRMRRGGK